MGPIVRAAAVLIEEGAILLVRERVSEACERRWSLPGGRVEPGETIEGCLVREVKEETGLEVAVERLLYLCERIEPSNHVVHITFAVRRVGGTLRPENAAAEAVMAPSSSLRARGFSKRFRELLQAGFPYAGTYQGSVGNIGL